MIGGMDDRMRIGKYNTGDMGRWLSAAVWLCCSLSLFSAEPFKLIPTGSNAVVEVLPLSTDLADEYMVRAWNTTDGLTQNHIDAVARDRDGYLWLATWSSLSRFNGNEFANFTSANTPELGDSTIVDLVADRKGDLWVSTYSGLYRVEGIRFERYGKEHGFTDEVTKRIQEDSFGNIWLCTDGGLFRFDGQDFTLYRPNDSSPGVRNIAFLTDGQAVVFGASSAFGFDPSTGQFGPPPFAPMLTERSHRGEVLPPDRDGVIWFRTMEHIYHWRPGSEPVLWRTLPESLYYERVLLLCDRRGDVWIAGNQPGVLERHSGGQMSRIDLEYIYHVNAFYKILEEDGLLWVCTAQGLIQLKQRAAITFGRRHGLPHHNVFSVAQSGEERALIGTQNGPAILDLALQQLEVVRLPGVDPNSRSVLPGDDGAFWIADAQRGPTFVASDRSIHISNLPWPGKNEVEALHRDSRGRLWIGTQNKLFVVENDTLRTLDRTSSPALGDDSVNTVQEMPDGTIWVGTDDGGITVLSPDGATVVQQLDKSTGLASDSVATLLLTDDGTVWAGGANGLSRIRDGICKAVTVRDGLPDPIVNKILPDHAGYFWLTGMQGVYRTRPDELSDYLDSRREAFEVMPVTTLDGLVMSETNGEQPAGFVDARGRPWIPTPAGVAVLNPGSFLADRRPNPPLIERITIDDEVLYDTHPGARKMSHRQDKLRLTAGRGETLRLDFAAPDIALSDVALFEVRLRGHDEQWRSVGQQTFALYTNLRPGDYSFELRVSDHHGHRSDTAQLLRFHLAAFPWQTRSFWVALILVVAAFAYVVHRRRLFVFGHIKQLEQRQALVSERERIARDMHDDLGSRLTHISMLADLSRNTGGESSTKLSELNNAARDAARAVEEIVWAANPSNDTLESLASYMAQYAENILATAGIACRVDAAFDWPEVYLSPERRHHVFMAFKEALNNLLKHAHATEVRLYLHPHEGLVHVRVSDNGKGFDPRARREDEQDGLANMDERMKKVGGRSHFESQPGSGTTISFQFPWQPPGT